MKLKELIKANPGLQYVADSLELMSSAGRRVMLNTEFTADATVLEAEWERTSLAINACAESGTRGVEMPCCECETPKSPTLNSEPRSPNSQRSALTDLRHCLMQLHDLQGTLVSLRSHVPLNEVELFEVKNLAHLNRQSRTAIAELGLESALPLPDLSEVFALLDPDGTGLPSFYIYDSYDPRLPALRRELKALQISGDDPGRATVLAAEQNNVQQEVCIRLSDRLHPYCNILDKAMETLAYADLLLAKAELSLRWGLTRPVVADGISYKGLFNPRLRDRNNELKLRYQTVDISLAPGACIITGANMAGKTVLLKSVGTAQQMVQLGMYAPADEAHVMLVDDVVASIGDEQDEMNGLSSFASEIIKISNIVQRCRQERMLVLVDEPARTTNPVEGKALVQALIGLLDKCSSLSLITTHYSQLGCSCRRLRVRGFVENMCDMPLTPQNINRFIDYSLTEDDADEVPQEALRIATILGCDQALLSAAREALPKFQLQVQH